MKSQEEENFEEELVDDYDQDGFEAKEVKSEYDPYDT
jgi:hypothetical protein